MNLADAPDVLKVEEAAQIARISTNAMYDLVRRGDVVAARAGGSIRISKTALVRWLEGDRPTAPLRVMARGGRGRRSP